MSSKRPVNLNLLTIHQPFAACMSIIHRISGVMLFFGTLGALYLLQESLDSEVGFEHTKKLITTHPGLKFFLWVLISSLIFHFIAGVKHLLLDFDIANGKCSGQVSAVLAFVLIVVLVIGAGVWIW